MSYPPKLTQKMNGYLHAFLSYLEAAIHPAAGKNEWQKTKRRQSKPSYSPQVSPDSLNMRANVRTQNGARRNPAP